jgi:hypothetical protein
LKISREERRLRSRIQLHRVHVSILKDPKYSKDKAYTRVETPAAVTYSTPCADVETLTILDETEELDENFKGVATSDHGFSQSTMVHEQNTPANDEQQGAINISSPRRRREREGKAIAIQYSVLSPGHVSKQLDRFIAESDTRENEQMEWESPAGRELLCHKCIKIIKFDLAYIVLPEEITYITPKDPKSPSNGREGSLTTIEEHL